MKTPTHFVVFRVAVVTITLFILVAVGLGAEHVIHNWYANGWAG
jgi:hypothetical protein